MNTEQTPTDEIRLTSSEWEIALDVLVIGPDGWDRSNLPDSWSELITEAEFKRRMSSSTVLKGRDQ